jgi:uncharacterized phiE125 gp8 family phage protein
MAHAPNPLVDLTTLADVKEFLGITSTTNDDLLQMLITAESDYIATWCNRKLVQQTITETRDGSGSDRMMFREYPVSAVASVTMDGNPVPASATPQNGYGYYFTSRILMLRYGWGWCMGAGNVQITYTAGYASGSIPQALAQAAAELTAYRYKQKDRIAIAGGQSIDGQSVQYGGGGRDGKSGANMGDMPEYVQTLLQNYKRVTQIMPS